MPQVDKKLIRTFKNIRTEISELDKNDRDNLIKIGASLEQTLSKVPAEISGLITLLKLCLEGLQLIYEKDVPDLNGLTNALADTIDIVMQSLKAENPQEHDLVLKKTWHTLWDTIQSNKNDNHEVNQKENQEDLSKLTLDDVAALLVQLDAVDRVGLSRVKEALDNIAGRDSTLASVQKIISQASQIIDEMLQENTSDPANNYDEVSRLIESAMNATEDSAELGNTQAEKPTPPPQTTGELSQFDQLPANADLTLLGEFITESREYIELAEAALLDLETNPEDVEAVNVVFRGFHTIKGTSAFLELAMISELAHLAESLLVRIRDREIQCAGGYADLALRSVDMLKTLLQILWEALNGELLVKPDDYDALMQILADPEKAGVTSEFDTAGETLPRPGDILVAQNMAKRKAVEEVATNSEGQPIGVAVVKSNAASLAGTAKALRIQKRSAAPDHVTESSVRVRTDRLDRLIDMVGELVIAQSMVVQDDTINKNVSHELSKKVAHTGKIVRDLQDLTMLMRMVPLKPTFHKMTRLVRDLARKSNKLVEFVTNGEKVEIDRNMVDIINDPLVHILRNAADHGIEPPEVREKNGKSKSGCIKLTAYYSGSNVVIEINDNGKGLDRNKIVEKAIAKGIIDSGQNMTENEVFNLIFEPGFSTKQKATDVSGRGVGMDVVKKGVEALKGRIDIFSEAGKGSTFTIRLPLTLAITNGMLVKVGDQRYIVPTINIHKSFRPEPEMMSTIAGRGEMVMLRDELMPVLRLHRLFNIQGAIEKSTKGLMVIIGDGNRRCALLVDELLGQHQVVAKTLGESIGKVQGVSGGAILGDGRVGLILDTSEIVTLARQ